MDWFERTVFGVISAVLLSLVGAVTWYAVDEATEIQAGTVVDKAYYPPDDLLVPVYSSCGQGCTIMTIIPVHVPECWALYLRDGEETGDVCTSKQTWDQTAEGQLFGN